MNIDNHRVHSENRVTLGVRKSDEPEVARAAGGRAAWLLPVESQELLTESQIFKDEVLSGPPGTR